MSYFLLNIVLALIWGAFSGAFNPGNLLLGFVLGYGALLLARRALPPSAYFNKVQQAFGFGLFFAKELILANLRVAADVLAHPSRVDVTGAVILEAVVNGLPAVATLAGSFTTR